MAATCSQGAPGPNQEPLPEPQTHPSFPQVYPLPKPPQVLPSLILVSADPCPKPSTPPPSLPLPLPYSLAQSATTTHSWGHAL